MENNKIVYIHRKKTDSTIFYVGIGEPKRAYVKYNRSSLWNNTVNKHGYYVEVILEGLSQEDACDIEIYLINKFGRKDLSLGALVNLTEGGEGIVNASEEKKLDFSGGKIRPTTGVVMNRSRQIHHLSMSMDSRYNPYRKNGSYARKRNAKE